MDESTHALLKKVLKQHGYSLTKPRAVVCGLLLGKEPLSMHELSDLSKGLLDRASLYRTIGLFERLGLVQRIYIGWKYKVELSDILAHHHHHISCLNCGAIVPITEEAEIEALIAKLAARHGYTPVSHQLEIHGYCATCAPTASTPHRKPN